MIDETQSNPFVQSGEPAVRSQIDHYRMLERKIVN